MTSNPWIRVVWALFPVASAFGLSYLPQRFKGGTALSDGQTWGCRAVSLVLAAVFGLNLLVLEFQPLGRIARGSLWTLELLSFIPPLLYLVPVGYIVRVREKRSLQSLGFARGRVLSQVGSGAAVYFSLVFLWSTLRYFGGKDFNPLYTNLMFGDLLHAMPIWQFLGFVFVVLVGGSADEVVFRGFVLIPVTRVLGPIPGSIATALFWSMAHFTNPKYTLSLFAWGLLFGWVYYRAGSLFPSLTLHALSNIGILSDYAFARMAGAGIHWTSQEHFLWVGGGSLGIAVLAVLVYLWDKRRIPLTR